MTDVEITEVNEQEEPVVETQTITAEDVGEMGDLLDAASDVEFAESLDAAEDVEPELVEDDNDLIDCPGKCGRQARRRIGLCGVCSNANAKALPITHNHD